MNLEIIKPGQRMENIKEIVLTST